MVPPDHVMAAEWLMLVLAYILVGLRAGVRVRLKQTHLLVSDILLLLGALCILGLVICDTITYRLGAMADFGMISEGLGKIRFATNYFFDAGLYFPKLSMLAIYFQLIPRHEKHLRWALYFITGFTVSAMLVTIFSDTFWCGKDPSVNWSTGPDACQTFTSVTLMCTNWAMCIACEALIFLLPIPLLRQVRALGRRQKAGLAVVFALGIITMIVSTGRFITMMYTGNFISIYIWATTEFSVSIMVVACMALRPLASKVWRATTSRRDTSKTRTNQRSNLASFTGTGSSTNRNTRRAAETLVQDWDHSGSEIGLNTVQPGEVVKTNCTSISSERQSKDGTGSVMEDRTCKDWKEHPKDKFVDAV